MSLLVLAVLGVLSALMSLLSAGLIFQLQASVTDSPALVSGEMTEVLRLVSAVFSALSLTLNFSSMLVCVLHAHISSELSRDTHRADWFLLDSRTVRHAAVGLFCLGVSLYLAALCVYMLLVFEVRTGIASVCVFSSGVLVLLLIVIHALILAARTAQHFRNDHITHRNDPSSRTGFHTANLNFMDQPWRHHSLASLHTHFSNPIADLNEKPQYSPSSRPHVHTSDKESFGGGGSGRTHRTLSDEPGLFHAQVKPWNGANREMRSVLARKATIKDSTLV